MEFGSNMSLSQFGCLWIDDVKIPSSEELVAEVDLSSAPKLNIALIKSMAHSKNNQIIVNRLKASK